MTLGHLCIHMASYICVCCNRPQHRIDPVPAAQIVEGADPCASRLARWPSNSCSDVDEIASMTGRFIGMYNHSEKVLIGLR